MKKIFYINKNGMLERKDSSLILKEKNHNIHYIPIEQLDLIICNSDITLNKRVLSLLNYHNISIIFFNFYNDYIGRFTPKKYSDGKIIMNQIESYNNHKRMIIVRSILEAELLNSMSLLKYYHKKENRYSSQINTIQSLKIKISNLNNVDESLLLEARIKKSYYSAFDTIIKNKDFIFYNREYNPTSNEVNALLSYGYAILYATILSDIDKSPLLPQISYIHSLSKQSDSLQFDIADILKPIIVDRLVFRLINKNQIKLCHFDYKNEACYLNKEGIKNILKRI